MKSFQKNQFKDYNSEVVHWPKHIRIGFYTMFNMESQHHFVWLVPALGVAGEKPSCFIIRSPLINEWESLSSIGHYILSLIQYVPHTFTHLILVTVWESSLSSSFSRMKNLKLREFKWLCQCLTLISYSTGFQTQLSRSSRPDFANGSQLSIGSPFNRPACGFTSAHLWGHITAHSYWSLQNNLLLCAFKMFLGWAVVWGSGGKNLVKIVHHDYV